MNIYQIEVFPEIPTVIILISEFQGHVHGINYIYIYIFVGVKSPLLASLYVC